MFATDLGSPTVLEKTLNVDRRSLGGRDRAIEAATSASFLLVALACLVLLPGDSSLDPVVTLSAVAVLALSVRVQLHFVGGYTAPLMLVFVPVLFSVPLPWVPLITACALMVSRLIDVLRRETVADRLVAVPGNAWFSVGPSVVLAVGGTGDASAATPALLVAALAAQMVTDFVPSAIREWAEDGVGLRQQLDSVRWVYSIDVALAPVGLLFALAFEHAALSGLLALPLLWILALLGRERRDRLEQMTELHGAYRGTAFVLGEVIEADDNYTGAHCRDVVTLALSVGRQLRLTPEQLRNLEFAALLHDVGKVAIPKEIINKPGPLDDREWALMKTHTITGQQMLDRIGGFMTGVGLVVRSHHERWDGDGYPDGLAGESIPVEARIIAACDTFSAMTTTRSYREAMSAEAAFQELRRCSGTQFDPVVVDAVLAAAGELVRERSVVPALEAHARPGQQPSPESAWAAGMPGANDAPSLV